MKKALSLILALLFVLALFSGCGKGQTPTPTPTQAPDTNSTQAPDTPATEEPTPSKYNLAAGKFEVDEHGFPTAPYDYPGPLTTSDETFTFWTVTYTPQLVPEAGYMSTPLPTLERELTGVHMEYLLVPSETRRENYSVLLASDDLCDVMTGCISLHPTTIEEAVEDGYYVNIWDYRDYCPNYIYQVTYDRKKDTNTYATVFRSPDFIGAFYTMSRHAVISMNYLARGDWLSKLGKTNDDIVTFDDLHDMLMGFKVNIDSCDYPWSMISTLDVKGYYAFSAYDTLPAVGSGTLGPMYVIDGTVYFSHVTERDKAFMTMINSWYNEGIIDPNWAAYANVAETKERAITGKVGYMMMDEQEINDYEDATPGDGIKWVPIKRPVLYENQTFHMGGQTSRLGYGTVNINAKCQEIPLLISWCDWRYSLPGSDAISWGAEGVMWEYDANGKRVITDWALSEPEGVGFGWLSLFYGFNALSEHGMGDGDVLNMLPGSERLIEIEEYWATWDYDAAYDYPTGAKLNQEQSDRVDQYKNDVSTYITENYLAFVDGSKPLSEWDSYVNGLMQHGFADVVALYQEAYDTYRANMVE